MKKERQHESFCKNNEERPPVVQPKVNLSYPRKSKCIIRQQL